MTTHPREAPPDASWLPHEAPGSYTPEIVAVLLDVDGTLVDSNDAHAAAWVEILLAAGRRDATFDRVRPLIGMGADQLLPQLGIDPASEPGKRMVGERTRLFLTRYMPRVRAFEGARDFVRRLLELELRVVIATSANGDELDALLRAAEVADLPLERTSSDDAERSKPHPDVVHAALSRAGCRPEQAMLVGDTRYDIEAARRAGVRAIAFRCGGSPEDTLHGAVEIYDGPAQLLAEIDSSPLLAARQVVVL